MLGRTERSPEVVEFLEQIESQHGRKGLTLDELKEYFKEVYQSYKNQLKTAQREMEKHIIEFEQGNLLVVSEMTSKESKIATAQDREVQTRETLGRNIIGYAKELEEKGYNLDDISDIYIKLVRQLRGEDLESYEYVRDFWERYMESIKDPRYTIDLSEEEEEEILILVKEDLAKNLGRYYREERLGQPEELSNVLYRNIENKIGR